MGHPVLKFEQLNDQTISISQSHFLLDKSSKPIASPYDYKWYIPFTHTIEKIGFENSESSSTPNTLWNKVQWILPNETNSKKTSFLSFKINQMYLFRFKEVLQLAKPLGADDFILANIDVAGFYRINYDTENWNKIIRQLMTNKNVIFFRNFNYATIRKTLIILRRYQLEIEHK
jgi:hypothetical protein